MPVNYAKNEGGNRRYADGPFFYALHQKGERGIYCK